MTFIYGLVCPIENGVRYIGKANNPKVRLRKHINDAKNPQNYNQRWIASLLRQGLRPFVIILCEVPATSDWRYVEREYIAHGKCMGLRLTNVSEGGEGVRVLDPEVEALRIAKISRTWKDPVLSAEQAERMRARYSDPVERELLRQKSKALWDNPEYARKVTKRVKEYFSTPEARAAQSERSRNAHANPENRKKRAASLAASWTDEETRERRIAGIKGALAHPDRRARKAQLMKERHSDPTFKAKIQAVMSDPEMIKRRNAAISAGHARRRAKLAGAG